MMKVIHVIQTLQQSSSENMFAYISWNFSVHRSFTSLLHPASLADTINYAWNRRHYDETQLKKENVYLLYTPIW